MKFLVTGGAGFIGSHAVDKLIEDYPESEIIVIDELNDYYNPAIKKNNIKHNLEKIVFYQDSICDKKRIEDIFKKERPTHILHFAARAGVRPSIKDPELYIDTNINGTYNILHASKQIGVKKVIFASSSSVYGINKKTPFSENDPIYRTISPYAATKLAAEQICSNFSYLHDMNITCLRFFTVYGPRQRPDLAIAKFFHLIEQGLEIPRYGNGKTGRDYTYVEDIIQGVMKALRYDGEQFDIFNLGESEPIELNYLIKTIENQIGEKINIKQMGLQDGDVPFTFADLTKSKKYLGYSPKTSFTEGIKKYYQWRQTLKTSGLVVS